MWRQDHNGFSHQDPGFIDHVVNKKAEVVRVYLPPDANTLLSTMDHCLRSRDYINVVVAGKQPAPNWLTMDEAACTAARGLGIWDWASNDDGSEPDVVLACAGDVPTLETLAAADLLRQHLPELKVRVVNVVDLMRLQPDSRAPARPARPRVRRHLHPDRPVIFAYHGYPWLIHRLTYRRTNHAQPARARLQGGGHHHHAVRHGDAQRPGPLPPGHRRHRPGARAGRRAAHLRQEMVDARQACRDYTRRHGEDDPGSPSGAGSGRPGPSWTVSEPRRPTWTGRWTRPAHPP